MKTRFALLVALLLGISLAQNVVFSPQSIVVNPIPSFEVAVSVDRDPSGNERPSYTIGDSIRISVQPSEDAYIYLFNVHSDGNIVQILPNSLDADGQNNFVRAGQSKTFPPANARYTFNVQGPVGIDKVIAVASKEQLDTSQLAQFSGGNFAESTAGEESFAQTLSIVVQPIPQNEWVTDTALFYIVQANTPPPEPQYGTILLTSSPAGARAIVDGQYVGNTPTRFGTTRGSHNVRFELDGYQPFSQSVNVPGGQTVTVNGALTAVPRTGFIVVNANPGGTVFIDGFRIGQAPQRYETQPGRHEIRIERDGYSVFRRSVDLTAGQTVNVDATLTPLTGSLQIISSVGNATVYINGGMMNSLNSNGRLTIPNLPAGVHELTLVREGYRTLVRDFEIVGGSTTTLNVTQSQ